MLLENCDVVASTKTHIWNISVDGYKLSRSARRGRTGGGIALYIKKECEELFLKKAMSKLKAYE